MAKGVFTTRANPISVTVPEILRRNSGANREIATEKIGANHVFVYKPNPARICAATPDWAGAERDIRDTLRIARGCPIHIVMKDTSTFCHQPERITRWCELASRIVREMD